jgi:hypothetical protein
MEKQVGGACEIEHSMELEGGKSWEVSCMILFVTIYILEQNLNADVFLLLCMSKLSLLV